MNLEAEARLGEILDRYRGSQTVEHQDISWLLTALERVTTERDKLLRSEGERHCAVAKVKRGLELIKQWRVLAAAGSVPADPCGKLEIALNTYASDLPPPRNSHDPY